MLTHFGQPSDMLWFTTAGHCPEPFNLVPWHGPFLTFSRSHRGGMFLTVLPCYTIMYDSPTGPLPHSLRTRWHATSETGFDRHRGASTTATAPAAPSYQLFGSESICPGMAAAAARPTSQSVIRWRPSQPLSVPHEGGGGSVIHLFCHLRLVYRIGSR